MTAEWIINREGGRIEPGAGGRHRTPTEPSDPRRPAGLGSAAGSAVVSAQEEPITKAALEASQARRTRDRRRPARLCAYERAWQRERAKTAMKVAIELWPGAHGQVLRDEIALGFLVLPWLGPTARTIRLIDQILDEPARIGDPHPKDLP